MSIRLDKDSEQYVHVCDMCDCDIMYDDYMYVFRIFNGEEFEFCQECVEDARCICDEPEAPEPPEDY